MSVRLFKDVKATAQVDTAKRTITAYASIFGNRDAVGDIVHPGAFADTIANDFPAGYIKTFRDHECLIGHPTSLAEDATGLLTESYISKTAKGDETLELALDGTLKHFSFAYDVEAADFSVDGKDSGGYEIVTRHLRKLKLYEVGPVAFPANPMARILGVKGLKAAVSPTGEVDVDFLVAHLPQLSAAVAAKGRLTSDEQSLLESLVSGFKAATDELERALAPHREAKRLEVALHQLTAAVASRRGTFEGRLSAGA